MLITSEQQRNRLAGRSKKPQQSGVVSTAPATHPAPATHEAEQSEARKPSKNREKRDEPVTPTGLEPVLPA
jgi:hypothetical protein